MTDTFLFSEGMCEVSGLGGFYERCCRVGVCAGAEWCAQHPRVSLSELPAANALTYAILEAPLMGDDGEVTLLGQELSIPQLQLVTEHVLYIAEHGWRKYEERMTAAGANGSKEARA